MDLTFAFMLSAGLWCGEWRVRATDRRKEELCGEAETRITTEKELKERSALSRRSRATVRCVFLRSPLCPPCPPLLHFVCPVFPHAFVCLAI